MFEPPYTERYVRRCERTAGKPRLLLDRGRTLIRMVSLIMQMEMVHRSSEYEADRKIRSDQKPRGLSKRTPGMLLASLSNLELIQGERWSRMTELTRDNRLIFKMFDVGPPKGIDRS